MNDGITDVVVMGGGATGQLAAAYLRIRFPHLKVAVVEGPHKDRPIVGESFVEITIDFLLELGLGSYLIEHHFPKYGLTYYFKTQIDHPEDRTYFVDETPTVPPLLSFQINRFTFDREVRRRNVENGVEMIDGSVDEIQLGHDGELHSLKIRSANCGEGMMEARRLIDATGRNRLLAKKLNLSERVAEQKDVFWFRLANFNPDILGRIKAVKKENRAFVTYFATHHFFGKGNWIWCIPMRAPDNSPLISIGITYRKDVYPYGQVCTMDQFLECVGREHKMIVELVRSGTVVDTNYYGSYMWECRQHYSEDRWYIIGDAGNTVDPLYSVGMALSSVQIRQIAAMIQYESNGHDSREFTRDLDTAISAFHHSLTRDTTRLYESMGDAYQCHLRVHLIVTKLFHLGLPALMNDYLWDPLGAKLINRFANLTTLESEAKEFHDLIREVAANPINGALENFMKVQSSKSMNYEFYEYHREEELPASLSRMLFGLARLRFVLLRKLGWRGWMEFRQQKALARDIMRGLALLPFHGRKLRQNWLVQRKFPLRENMPASREAIADFTKKTPKPASDWMTAKPMMRTQAAGSVAQATHGPLADDN